MAHRTEHFYAAHIRSRDFSFPRRCSEYVYLCFSGIGLYSFCFEHFPYGYYFTECKGKVITNYSVLTTDHKVYDVL
jgi:hypothetical protein